MAQQKGTPTHPGTIIKYRDRPVEENLKLFTEMKEGNTRMEAKCCAPRSIWRTSHAHARPGDLPHQARPPSPHGDAWCIYPMYDFAHGQSVRH